VVLAFSTTQPAPSVSSTPIFTACLKQWMTLEAFPLGSKPGADADGAGEWVVRVPLLGQGGVVLDRTAWTKATTPTVTLGADQSLYAPCNAIYIGLPLVNSTTSVSAAWALQPHLLTTAVGEVRRRFSLVFGWVPPLLDLEVLRVRQGLSSHGVEAWA